MSVRLNGLAMDDIQKQKKMTGITLAQLAGCSSMTISKARQGKPVQMMTAQRIARALGVDLKEILMNEAQQEG